MDQQISRRALLKTVGAGAATLSLSELLAAYGSTSSAQAAGGKPVDSINWALTGAQVSALDVLPAYYLSGQEVMSLCQECLLTTDSHLRLQPLLAKSWDQPDEHHYVYNLRSDVKFADGSPMTADDVVFSFERNLNPKAASQIATFFQNVSHVRATGKRQVTVTMKRPDTLFKYVPTFVYILSKSYVQKLGAKYGTPGPQVTLLGTGPYQLTAFNGATATVEVNKNYWRGTPHPTVKKATFQWITNPQTIYLAMQAGSIDGVVNFRPDQYKGFDALKTATVSYGPAVTTFFWCFNVEAPPWNDIHVRRAIGYATNRAGYVSAFLDNHGEAAKAIPTQASWANLATPAQVKQIYNNLPDLPYNLNKAKAELAKSKFSRGFSAEIKWPDIAPDLGQAMVSLSSTLKSLNINLTVRELDASSWVAEQLTHKNLGMNVKGPNPDFMDPVDVLQQILPSKFATVNGINLANYKNPVVDRLLQAQNSTSNPNERRRILTRICHIIGDDLPYFPVYALGTPLALSSRFSYPTFNPLFNLHNWVGAIKPARRS